MQYVVIICILVLSAAILVDDFYVPPPALPAYSPLGWSDLALFSVFENLHISIDHGSF